MKRLVSAVLIAASLSCGQAQAEDDGWRLIMENDAMAVYVTGPVNQMQMKADGIGMRIKSKQNDSDMVSMLVKAGCQEKQLYVIGGMDMDPEEPVKDALVMPQMRQFTWDAPDGTVYGKIREMMCGRNPQVF